MDRRTRREQGSALLVAVLMLVLMGAIGIAGLNTVTQDRQAAGYQGRKRIAFYAAETGLAEARDSMRNGNTPSVSTSSVGDSSIYPYGQPAYQQNEVEDLGTRAIPGFQLRISGNGPVYQLHYHRIQVQGTAPGGTTATHEIVANTFDASG